MCTANGFLKRILLFFMEPALFPPSHITRALRPITIHAYTLIQVSNCRIRLFSYNLNLFLLSQILAFALVWIAETYAAIAFPLVVLALMPVRM